ncbi:YcbK family protein [Paraburkholderia terricola]|uniref:Murein endopeptidase K n=1 Tax=Paraburkholderia terricola TaxID=169427 RepID=A0ABU1LKS1_9BURK|nr:DUF882 domain-containing protein [Paraburkholderia terricola]MDR6407353.1 uncharacterized protein YcbK (DUF882 family) [Paraburkholderia terricola]MDR6478970.1 uncharacterized protein YcbK (DUF882 family) [Paraburkholderia terricola]
MISRREFVRKIALAACVAPALAPFDARADNAANATNAVPTLLWLRRGSEERQIDYSTAEGYRAVSWLMRDVKANVVGNPDWRLLQQWSWMQAWLAAYGHHARFDVHSGLRTPATNTYFEGKRASFHLPDRNMVFRAGDFSTPAAPSEYMGRLAYLSQQGGVGFYQTRDFIHTDVRGRVVTWRAR